MNEKVGKGNIIQDPLFLEAEKLGFDIRMSDDSNKKTMSFGFFDSEIDPFASTVTPMEVVGLFPEMGDKGSTGVFSEPEVLIGVDSLDVDLDSSAKIIVYRPLSIVELVDSARRFKRDR